MVRRLDIGLHEALHIRHERLSVHPDACQLMYVSDIHLRSGRSDILIKRIIESAHLTVPDAILLGGDLVDRVSELGRLSELVGSLRHIAPVLAVGGNHDSQVGLNDVRNAVVDGGGVWIHETLFELTHGHRKLSIGGPNSPAAASADADVRILCAHNPRVWRTARDQGFDLVLAGHLHGCQFVLFEFQNRLFPGAFFYPYCYLTHQYGSTRLVVSRGVSDLIPIRWRCPREVVLCHI